MNFLKARFTEFRAMSINSSFHTFRMLCQGNIFLFEYNSAISRNEKLNLSQINGKSCVKFKGKQNRSDVKKGKGDDFQVSNVFFFLSNWRVKIMFTIMRFFYQPSRLLNGDWVSARPFTFNLSAVFKKEGNCSCETFTSPAYMNSRIACKWLNETSFRMMIGCFDGFSSRSVLK